MATGGYDNMKLGFGRVHLLSHLNAFLNLPTFTAHNRTEPGNTAFPELHDSSGSFLGLFSFVHIAQFHNETNLRSFGTEEKAKTAISE